MKYFALLLVLACNEPSKKPPPPSADPVKPDACATALASFDKFVDTGDPDTPADQRTKVKAAIHDRCVTDAWSEAALACMRAAGTSHDTFQCWNQQLTKEQRDAASKALGDLKL